MQVKKFEARSMQEALEMVKKQLGPEAIILHAKDNRKRFGLVGQGSVEITAAIADEVLYKKSFVESKLTERDRDKFQASPARVQKQIMSDFVRSKKEEAVIERVLPTKRYIDIEDEGGTAERSHLTRAQALSLEDEVFQLRKAVSQMKKSNQNLAQNHYPGVEFSLPMELSASFDKLVNSGIAAEFAAEILEQLQKEIPEAKLRSKSTTQNWLQDYFQKNVAGAAHHVQHKLHFFFGEAGHGKTSAAVKLATHYLRGQRKKVMFAAAADFRLGGDLQLKYFAQIFDVPFYNLREPKDWQMLEEKKHEFDHILVEFSSPEVAADAELNHFAQILQSAPAGACHHLVCSAPVRPEALQKTFDRFFRYRIDDLVFSHFSEHVGGAFQFMFKNHLPLFSTHRNVRHLAEFEWGGEQTFRGVMK